LSLHLTITGYNKHSQILAPHVTRIQFIYATSVACNVHFPKAHNRNVNLLHYILQKITAVQNVPKK